MPAQVFRAGVALVVERSNGDILAMERADVDGAWQLPQGGVDVGEAPVDAAWRELREETGLDHGCVELSFELPEWIAYEWPEHIRRQSTHGRDRRGQIQKWFFFRLLDESACEPVPDGREFRDWRWMKVDELLGVVADFRQAAYLRAFSAERT